MMPMPYWLLQKAIRLHGEDARRILERAVPMHLADLMPVGTILSDPPSHCYSFRSGETGYVMHAMTGLIAQLQCVCKTSTGAWLAAAPLPRVTWEGA